MTTPAFQGELMLAGWAQNHNSGPKVTFFLADDEALEAFKHLTVKKGNTAGQRFMAVLVQIGDDERPIEPGADTAKKHNNLVRAAGIVCTTEGFQAFVQSKRHFRPDTELGREEQAAAYIREFCGVSSRSMLDTVESAGRLYGVMMSEYRVFQGIEESNTCA